MNLMHDYDTEPTSKVAQNWLKNNDVEILDWLHVVSITRPKTIKFR